MNPQDPLASSSQPVAVASETLAHENGPDEVAKEPSPELPQSPSTDNSSGRLQPSMAPVEIAVNMLQLSTHVVSSTASAVATFAAHNSADFKRLENGNYGPKQEGQGEVEDDRKREREHKKRSKNWTRVESLKLIRARAGMDERFTKTGRKGALWDEIAQNIQDAGFSRDAQQCKDKWEKLVAGYKEVRDGTRDRDDHPFYDELHPLLSWKPHRKEGNLSADPVDIKRVEVEVVRAHKEAEVPCCAANGGSPVELREDQREDDSSPRKRKRESEQFSLTDLGVVQELLESVITRQQRFFKDLLDALERKEQLREQIRHEREEKWRAEERAQRFAFNDTMVVLTQRLLGERAAAGTGTATTSAPMVVDQPGGTKKRSKNWKRTEVLQLIRCRRDMEDKFSKSTRRAGLWEELAEKLGSAGIKRDGKQCREKWDKLMAGYKDVSDGRKDQDESPYFSELTAFMGKTVEPETTKEEYVGS